MIDDKNEKKEESSKSVYQRMRENAPVIFDDPKSGIKLRKGEVLQGKGVRGGRPIFVLMNFYYSEADKRNYALCAHNGGIDQQAIVKKYILDDFLKALESGDIWLADWDSLDWERMSQGLILMDSILNRRTPAEIIDMSVGAIESERIGENDTIF